MFNIFQKNLWTKYLTTWYLYDFANSLLIVNTTLYFSQWVVVDRGVPDFWFALPFIVATAILIFLSPYAGEIGDQRRKHYQIFLYTTLAAIISALLMFLAGRLIVSPLLGVVIALFFYAFYQLFIQLAFVPYNAFIKHIAPADSYGKVSGLGFAFGEAGHMVGLLLTLPIIYGIITIFGTDRLAPLLPTTFAFLLLAIPSFLALPKVRYPTSPISREPFWKTFWKNLKESRNYPGVFPLLIAFYFFSDAIITISLFSAIYLQNVFGAPDPFKVQIFILVLIGFILGSGIGGFLADRLGHRRVLVTALTGTVFTIATIAMVNNMAILNVLFPLFGFSSSAVYASSKAYLASLIPREESGKFFGLYAFSERFASIIGPAVWGITVWIFAGLFPWNYRAAAIAMAILVAIGIIPLIYGQKNANLAK